MNNLWYNMLSTQAAVFNDDQQTIAHFGMPEIERHCMKHGAVMSSLAHMGLIRFSGEDAKTFLQGQLTQDIHLVSNNQAQLAAYCDPQGNVLGLGILFFISRCLLLASATRHGVAAIKTSKNVCYA